jgi:hypothetical protein
MQCNRGFQMRQLFTESVREPRKTAHRHPHRQILPFNKAGRNVIRVGIALPMVQIPKEGRCVRTNALTDPERRHQLGFCINYHVNPRRTRPVSQSTLWMISIPLVLPHSLQRNMPLPSTRYPISMRSAAAFTSGGRWSGPREIPNIVPSNNSNLWHSGQSECYACRRPAYVRRTTPRC